MLPVYIASLALGGVLLGVSLFGGHAHDGELGGDVGGHGADGHATVDHDVQSFLLPFLSLRFWVFALCFFGLTGSVLHGFGLALTALVPWIAGAVGLGTGYTASRLLMTLTHSPVGLLGDANHVGREGKLLLPLTPGQRGKLRLQGTGQVTDLIAESASGHDLPAGASVLIIEMRGAVAVVEPAPLAARKELT
jgi:membrane protein implicated in regulation of membrane protease activity